MSTVFRDLKGTLNPNVSCALNKGWTLDVHVGCETVTPNRY